jgi:hypothetical protein
MRSMGVSISTISFTPLETGLVRLNIKTSLSISAAPSARLQSDRSRKKSARPHMRRSRNFIEISCSFVATLCLCCAPLTSDPRPVFGPDAVAGIYHHPPPARVSLDRGRGSAITATIWARLATRLRRSRNCGLSLDFGRCAMHLHISARSIHGLGEAFMGKMSLRLGRRGSRVHSHMAARSRFQRGDSSPVGAGL